MNKSRVIPPNGSSIGAWVGASGDLAMASAQAVIMPTAQQLPPIATAWRGITARYATAWRGVILWRGCDSLALPPTAQGLAWLKVWQRLKHYHRPPLGMGQALSPPIMGRCQRLIWCISA
ncbi:hypothetical protein NKT77_10035 [Moraxella sp. FZLJ2107]|uniref:hypothetical protein n=1 Tax=unclassified Moraxella TaxID=2685852 RepID=UPI0020C9158D|nr:MULTISPECIES: hypothetical protein [unclassified Moraxella]UTO04781.1 hypothetical protein NKT77_09805 [Moraxella sp. FZLJ2107]UTO04827.1 hypothetical protein NKT77_10035 [Moraxella sp. FZLJ2107]UTO21513.1 hypothetical protein NKU06_06610 [Moraxella sp. FZLJ2109]